MEHLQCGILVRTEQSEKFKTKSLTGKNGPAQSITKKDHVHKVLKKIMQVLLKPIAAYFI